MIVVLVDTLRADRLSLYGYRRETSPALDRFAAERGVVFTNAWANAGCTFPSANSILTGVWPQRFLEKLRENGMAIPPALPSLAERFAAHGYATAAVSASPIVRKTPSVFNKQGGFDRGFATFDETCLDRAASCVNERALARIGGLAEPFFLYLHYMDPHQPYHPPRGALRTFSSPTRRKARPWARNGMPTVIQKKLYEGGTDPFDADDVRHLSNLYDDEVRYLDSQLGDLFAALERSGQLERTAVVVVADHGEELYDNRNWSHCRDLAFDTLFATPFLIAAPGVEPGRRDDVVSNVDLVPTLLELAGVSFDPATFDGRSLAGLLSRSEAALPARFAFAAQGTSRAASDGRRMMRIDLRDLSSSLAALERPDRPGGARAAPADSTGPEATALRRALLDWIRRIDRNLQGGESVRRAEEIERQLKAVGYL